MVARSAAIPLLHGGSEVTIQEITDMAAEDTAAAIADAGGTGGVSQSTLDAAIAAEAASREAADALLAPLDSPALTGTPTAPTPSPGDNDTSVATTAFVTDAVSTEATARASAVSAEATARASADALLAPLASPALTGSPTAPTASPGDNDTSIATTAFVTAAVSAEATSRSNADALLAPLASPALTGSPTAPTASPGDNDTSIATTAFVTAAVAAEATSRSNADALLAPLASPALTGSPTAPTATAGDNDTSIATTAFVAAAIALLKAEVDANVGRNLIHNGEFLIQQRGTGAFTGNNTYSADRWMQEIGGNTTLSTSIVALNDTDRAAIGDEAALWRLTPSWTTGTIAAGDLALIEQRMEGTQRYGGKNLTISFWAKAAVGTPSIGVGLRQNFGSGGSPSAAVDVNATAVALTTTWGRKTVTLAVPSTSGKTIGTTAGTDYTAIRLFLASGTTNNTIAGGIGDQSSNIVQIWGVQVEIGSAVTPLEKRSLAHQLLECQRFYQVHSVVRYINNMPSGAQNPFSETLSPPMRVTPTTSVLSNGNINTTGFAITPGANYYVTMNFTASGTSDTEVAVQFSASADL